MRVRTPPSAALVAALPALLLQAQDPAPSPAKTEAPAPPPTAEAPRFDIDTDRQEVVQFLEKFSAQAKVPVRVVGYLPLKFSIQLRKVTFEEGLQAVCQRLGIGYRRTEDGTYVVGHHTDLLLEFADASDSTEVDVTYRCRHLSADSLAGVITKSFSSVKAITGPLFLSPNLESAGNTSLSDSVKALGATDQSFKTHDVLLSGPANQVKRALVLARKFDRVRKQVRINARLTEMSVEDASDLGLTWTFPSVALQEIPDASAGVDKSVKGIKFGSFAHSAVTVGAAIQAKEQAGRAKTLANPSISLVDGERSFILIGERRLYPKQTGTNSQGLPIFDVAEVKTGVYLQVAVQVGLDNELVLTAYPQVSSVTKTETINNSQYPIISTREAQTTVQLRSGEMLAIGGLISESDSKNVTKVPILGWIPLVGELFTFRSKSKTKSELVLILTPEIIDSEGPTESIRPAAG